MGLWDGVFLAALAGGGVFCAIALNVLHERLKARRDPTKIHAAARRHDEAGTRRVTAIDQVCRQRGWSHDKAKDLFVMPDGEVQSVDVVLLKKPSLPRSLPKRQT